MDSISEFFKTIESYDTAVGNCYAFRYGSDVVDGLPIPFGNMLSGFPFEIDGIRFNNSEAAYIVGAFSNDIPQHLEIQTRLVNETNGFMAKKRIGKLFKDNKREDWSEFKLMWMLYVVWMKCLGNDEFRNHLMSLPKDSVIIEDSTFQRCETATLWGARNLSLRANHNILNRELKKGGLSKNIRNQILSECRLKEWRKEGEYVGCNAMGKILMFCRDALMNHTIPPIDFDFLREKHIYLLGELLTFDDENNHTLVA